jgi:hypothetical protein
MPLRACLHHVIWRGADDFFLKDDAMNSSAIAANHAPHKPHHHSGHTQDPDEFEPGLLPVDPDKGPVPELIPTDPQPDVMPIPQA